MWRKMPDPASVVSTTCDRLARTASRRRRSASRAALAGLPDAMLRAMASGSMISIPTKPLMRVRVDLPHPFGPDTTRRVGSFAAAGRVRRVSAQTH